MLADYSGPSVSGFACDRYLLYTLTALAAATGRAKAAYGALWIFLSISVTCDEVALLLDLANRTERLIRIAR
jgi:hypothetical protein